MNKITYLIAGKTQYKLHSPFVFSLYTEVLLPKVDKRLLKIKELSYSDRRNAAFVYKIVDYYELKNVFMQYVDREGNNDLFLWAEDVLPEVSGVQVNRMGDEKDILGSPNLLLCDVAGFVSAKEERKSFFSTETVAVVTGIHTSSENERLWRVISNDNSNILVIDIYSMGIVFFRKELSVQRFILKV